MKKNVFIPAMPLETALSMWFDKINSLNVKSDIEDILVSESLGRITGDAVTARISSPFYHSSAMDGYAVRFQDTFGASETAPKRLKIEQDAFYVDTGDPIPDGMSAVIMVEDVHVDGDYIEFIEPVTPWHNIRTVGEDIVETELIVPEGHRLRPVDMTSMLASGHTNVKVKRKPRVMIIPTGTEIVEPGTLLKKGDIIEYNSIMLGGMAVEAGAEFLRHSIVPDDFKLIRYAVSSAVETADIVIINAGASAGSEDYSAGVIKDLGEVVLHGVNIRPGKPLILGVIKGKPVLGIPGYPVSAYITFRLFGLPVINKMLGLAPDEPEFLKARLSRQIASPMGQEEYLRVKVGKVGDRYIATPLGRGAGQLMSLVRADGLLRIPAMTEGMAAGDEADIILLKSIKEIKNTVVMIGSHDNCLDILANIFKKRYPAYSLSSAHVGSMGGLVALKTNEAHIAPAHLLDEETGTYNVPFIKRLMPDKKIMLVNLVHRVQGLMVKKGNPKNIGDFKDLLREHITFINRQRGAGTRLLLDKRLKELRIDPNDIKGYSKEEYTHMAVASAVLTGVADTGLGVLSAANALGLDFIPVTEERYDLAIPSELYETDMIRAILDVIRNDKELEEGILKMGGYDIKDKGKVMYDGA